MDVVRPIAVVFTLRDLEGTHTLPVLSFLTAGNSLGNILATSSAVHTDGALRMDLVRWHARDSRRHRGQTGRPDIAACAQEPYTCGTHAATLPGCA
jgi:hypothetical protein